METTNDRIEQQQTTVFIAESGGHLMAALFGFLKETFNGIGGADTPPVVLRKLIKGEAFGQIAVEAVTSAGIGLLILE